MDDKEILSLWDCNKITCVEALQIARANEIAKNRKIFEEILTELEEYKDTLYVEPFRYNDEFFKGKATSAMKAIEIIKQKLEQK